MILLIAGIGLLAWWYASHKEDDLDHSKLPDRDPLLGLQPTPSMMATLKYFWVVTALILVQVGLGAVTAHYGVEGSGFYGFNLAEFLPYSLSAGPGTSSSPSSGSRLPGWRPVCSSHRRSPDTNRSSSGWGSTSSSARCS